jgi:peptidoglycan/xylan/chitin deacetylase (PgdA/CDA1 family)
VSAAGDGAALTVVMYHYVRDLPRTRFPRIKGLTTGGFDGQLDYIQRHYQVVGAPEVLAAARGEAGLPPRACLLTFDDGLCDHRDEVAPRLAERGLAGCFYASAVAAERRTVMDVHKIHFILAANEDVRPIAAALRSELARRPVDVDALWAQNATAGKYDPPEVMAVKRLLQKALPEKIRVPTVDALFRRFVTADESAFAEELYLGAEDLRALAGAGFEIGGHGDDHAWLGTLDRDAQRAQVRRSAELVRSVRGDGPWTFAYPHGSRDATTVELLAEAGFAAAFTTEVGLAGDLAAPLELPRLDTNHLPRSRDAAPADWTPT